jgi:hypothetical protein
MGAARGETEAAMVGNGQSSPEELEALLVQRRVSRADFLRLLGVGLGLTLVPTSLGALGTQASVAQTLEAAATPNLLSGGQYPIGVWWPPPLSETTQARYAEIAQAGFNFVIGGNGVVNDAANPAALDAAAASGLRLLLTDTPLQRMIRDSGGGGGGRGKAALDPDALSIMRHLLDREEPAASPSRDFSAQATSADVAGRIEELLTRYPGVAGINLYDEPSRALFAALGSARGALQKISPDKLPYVIALPSYATQSARGTATYEAYLERYMSVVKPPVLSFGHYPLLAKGITRDYFYNWAQIRKSSLRFGVPSWVFIQSVDFDPSSPNFYNRRRPNEAGIRWQVNVSLAYGAKGIQYFTYWTPTDTPQIKFGQALISKSGSRTPLYGYARKVNAYLRVVGKELLPLVSETVVHAREKRLPPGAKRFKADNYIRSVSGSPVILGRFRKPGLPSARYLLAVNRSPSKVTNSRLRFAKGVRKVFGLNIGSGRYVGVALRGKPKRELPVRLGPGGARLYLLRRG